MSDPMTRRLLLFTAGSTGERVSQVLSRAGIPVVVHDVQERPAWSEADFADLLEQAQAQVAAAALWRPYPALMESFNAAAYRRAIPWTVGSLDGTLIQLGPTVFPGATACYACFSKRFLTNSGLTRVDIEIAELYNRNQSVGHHGQIAALEQLAANLIGQEIIHLSRGEPCISRGIYWYLDPVRINQGQHVISPVPWCPVCSTVEQPQEASFASLSKALAETLFQGRETHV